MTRHSLFLIASLGSAALLVGAWTFQYFGLAPCPMCVWQRWPHGIAVALGIISLLQPHLVLALLGAAATATTGAIGVYHSGVERGVWKGPSTCGGNDTVGLSADQLLERIMEAPLVRCNEVAWQMFGVTIPNLNAALSFTLAAIWLIAAWKCRN